MKLDRLTAAFLEACAPRYRPHTLRGYRYDLARLVRAFPELGARQVKVDHLRAFLYGGGEETPGTLARRRAALASCFGWALRQGHVAADPTALLERVQLPQKDPRPLTEAQAEAILAAVPARPRRNRLLFTMLYETGMRVGEALAVNVEDALLNQTDGGALRLTGKGNRERLIPLIDAPRTVRLLGQELKNGKQTGPLFSGNPKKGGQPGAPLHYTTVHHHFSRALESARRKHPELFEREAEPVTIHRLRHTWATSRLRDGVPITTVRRMLGHRNLETTMRYAEPDLVTMQRDLVEGRRRHRRSGRS